jgi:ABC-type antimicrobial peptide transport system permease subunit
VPNFFLVVRTATSPLSYRQQIERGVHRLDGNLPIADVRAMSQTVDDSMARRRFTMLLLSALGGVALVLVIAGIYGVMTYVVNQNRRELGIRLALGATTGELQRLVLSDGLRVTVVGILIGLPLARALSRYISSQLYEIKPFDPAIYAGAALLMLGLGAVACVMPAARAARMDPGNILRND